MKVQPSAAQAPWLAAAALVVLGCSPLLGGLLHRAAWVDVARSSAAAPVVWESGSEGADLAHFGVRVWIQWRGVDGRLTEIELDPQRVAELSGPPARASLVRLALTRVPELDRDRPDDALLGAFLEYLMCGERKLLRELGVPLQELHSDVSLLFQSTGGDHEQRPPQVFPAPCPDPEVGR